MTLPAVPLVRYVPAMPTGDGQAFAALVDGWSGSMLRMVRLHVPTDSAADEVVQETWLAVLTGLDKLGGESSLRTWVYSILLKQAKSRGHISEAARGRLLDAFADWRRR